MSGWFEVLGFLLGVSGYFFFFFVFINVGLLERMYLWSLFMCLSPTNRIKTF